MTTEQVCARAATLFPNEVDDVLARLEELAGAAEEPDRERVQLAVLELSAGKRSDLDRYLKVARRDYREVLYLAEQGEAVEGRLGNG